MPDPIEFDPSVMTLLAGLAHEINTPLGAIKSNNEIVDLARFFQAPISDLNRQLHNYWTLVRRFC